MRMRVEMKTTSRSKEYMDCKEYINYENEDDGDEDNGTILVSSDISFFYLEEIRIED